VVMDAFPLSANGKVDRRLLPAPQAPASVTNGARARNETQEIIAGIWKSILNIPDVGVEANFFDLGGDSLALIGVHARVQKALNVELSITDLFQHTTISSLARHLDSQAQERPAFSEAQNRGLTQRAAIRDLKSLRVRQGQ
jgi:acyl carrier protein